MNNIDWNTAELYIKDTLKLTSSTLDKETIEAVQHYIDHDELEMAFEGLFIELMKTKKTVNIDTSTGKETALFLKLDKETVYDPDFWIKFETFCKEK